METVTNFFGITKPAETEQTLEAERRKCNEDIDERLKTLRDAAAAAPVAQVAPVAPVDAAAPTMGGGRRSTKRSTKRSRRSKKTKQRRGKRSGKRTRR